MLRGFLVLGGTMMSVHTVSDVVYEVVGKLIPMAVNMVKMKIHNLFVEAQL